VGGVGVCGGNGRGGDRGCRRDGCVRGVRHTARVWG
jgi:hypothetical protein